MEEKTLRRKQRARIEALTAARTVLTETSGGPFASTRKAVDVGDLVTVARYIIDGKDPWPVSPLSLDLNVREAQA